MRRTMTIEADVMPGYLETEVIGELRDMLPTLGLDPRSAWLLAFALSFSSTVFAVKTLSESGETGSMHGRLAIGILIMQDIFAVLFLTLSTGKLPYWPRSGQDLVVTWSDDGGRTWAKPVLAAEHGNQSICPNALVYDRHEDTLHALYRQVI